MVSKLAYILSILFFFLLSIVILRIFINSNIVVLFSCGVLSISCILKILYENWEDQRFVISIVNEFNHYELYKMVKTLCQKLNIDTPNIYIHNEEFDSSYIIHNIFGKPRLYINALDLENNDVRVLQASLAHELSHIKLKHGYFTDLFLINRLNIILFIIFILKLISLKIDILGSLIFGFIYITIVPLFLILTYIKLLSIFYKYRRKYELEADTLSVVVTGDKESFINMITKNGLDCKISNSTSSLYDTHPTCLERINSIIKQNI